MRFFAFLLLLPLLARADALPKEMNDCSLETDIPNFPGVMEKIVAASGYSDFERKRILAAGVDPIFKEGVSRKFVNCESFDEVETSPGQWRLRCKSLKTVQDWEKQAQKLREQCEEKAKEFSRKYPSEFSGMSCRSHTTRTENIKVVCEDLGQYLDGDLKNLAAKYCDEKSISGVVGMVLTSYPMFVLTNKGKEPEAKQRRCMRTRDCVRDVLRKTNPKPSVNGRISNLFAEKKNSESDELCDAQEAGGFSALVKKLRELGLQFEIDKTQNKDDPRTGPTIGAGSRDERSGPAR